MERQRSQDGDAVLDVVESVAEETGTDPTELPLLDDAIDTDSIQVLLNSDAHIEISFPYAGCWVVADSSGRVSVDGWPAAGHGDVASRR